MQHPAAPAAGRPQISFAGVNKSYGARGAPGGSNLALADFDLHIGVKCHGDAQYLKRFAATRRAN